MGSDVCTLVKISENVLLVLFIISTYYWLYNQESFIDIKCIESCHRWSQAFVTDQRNFMTAFVHFSFIEWRLQHLKISPIKDMPHFKWMSHKIQTNNSKFDSWKISAKKTSANVNFLTLKSLLMKSIWRGINFQEYLYKLLVFINTHHQCKLTLNRFCLISREMC